MSNRRLRLAVAAACCAATAIVVPVVLPVVATNAAATPPPPPSLSETAARPWADGGPGSVIVVDAATVTRAADGAVLYFDQQAFEIRRVDPATRQITVLAGTGSSSGAHSLDGTTDPKSLPLPLIDGLWTDSAGDVFAQLGLTSGGALYRLAAADDRWHLAVSTPPAPPVTQAYAGFAVTGAGDVIAVDATHSVLRRFAPGDDPAGGGTIIAGKLNVPGTSGDGGQAKDATISPNGAAAVSPAGDVYFADGGANAVRRVNASNQIIATLADPAIAATYPSSVIAALAVSSDGNTVYALRSASAGHSIVRAMPIAGGTASTVAGPLPDCASNTEDCLGTSLVAASDSGTASVVVAGQGSLLSWPADGSSPLAYHRFAGVLNDAKGVRSPDGTTLNQAFLTPIYDLAQSPSGSIAIATLDGIRSVSGLAASSTLGTVVPAVSARQLHYADDGTLYAFVSNPDPQVIAVPPGGPAVTVVGGGTSAPAAGGDPTAMALPWNTNIAVDPSNGTLYFDTGLDSVWRLAKGAQSVQLAGSVSGLAGELVAARDHSVLVAVDTGLERIDSGGATSPLDCTAGCPSHELALTSDGTVIGTTSSGAVLLRAPDGTLQALGAPGYTPLTVTSDDRILTWASSGWSGGLLAYSGPIAAPAPVDAPTVTATPIGGGVDVTVDPVAAVSGQHLRIWAGRQDSQGEWIGTPTLADDTITDGSGTTYDRTLLHLFSAWTQGADAATATYRIEVIASEGENQPGNTIANAPLVLHVTPTQDNTPPAKPTMAGTFDGTLVTLTITPPADPDFDRVVVCQSVDAAAPGPRQGCTDVAELTSGPGQVFRIVDSLFTTVFTAFALDASGNASAGVTYTRPAAQLVSGAAVANIGYAAQATGEEIVWPGSSALHVRYAAGTTPPLTFIDGLEAGQHSGFFGTGALVPVAKGAKVAVSIFAAADAKMTTYRRTSFVVTGGTNSDSLSLTATSIVVYGRRPAVGVALVRHTVTGTYAPLAGQLIYLYRRPVGGAWSFVTSARTSSTGRVAFTVPLPAGTTYYQARYRPLHTTSALAASGIARTLVRQVITALLPASGRHGRAMIVTGSVAPHRVASVHLQRYRSGHWSTVASARSTRSGAFRIRYVPASAGRWRYRVLVDATSTLLAAATPSRWISIA